MKTRKAPAQFNGDDAQTYMISQVVKWAVPPGKKFDETPLVAREDDVVTVTGWVRLVKSSPDDCDIHIQLAPSATKHYLQMIAEIPLDSGPLRHALADALGHNVTKQTQYFDGNRTVSVTLTPKRLSTAPIAATRRSPSAPLSAA